SATGAALLASLLVWLGPPGTDLAAHVYQRTLFLEHGFVLWNNFWYSGRYSFVTYSVLYYPLAAVLGIKLLAVLIVAVSVASFAVLVRHEWGEQSKWAIRAVAVVWAGLVLSAAYPFMLGIALALLALCSLQRGQRALFIGCTLLTITASPLAFLLLVVVLAGVALARRGDGGRFVQPALAIAAIGALEFLLRRMFPGRGSFPFSVEEFVAASTFCLIGLGLTWGIPRARILRWTFAVYLVACIAAFAVSSPVGENIARLRFAAAPIAILTVSLRNWRPWPICALALALAASWNLTPLAASFAHGVEDPPAKGSYWPPTIAYLPRHRTATATVFEVPSPRPLVSAPARVLELGYASIRLRVPAPGVYRLNVTYAPYWHTPSGCLSPTADGMSELTVTRPGVVSLHFGV